METKSTASSRGSRKRDADTHSEKGEVMPKVGKSNNSARAMDVDQEDQGSKEEASPVAKSQEAKNVVEETKSLNIKLESKYNELAIYQDGLKEFERILRELDSGSLKETQNVSKASIRSRIGLTQSVILDIQKEILSIDVKLVNLRNSHSTLLGNSDGKVVVVKRTDESWKDQVFYIDSGLRQMVLPENPENAEITAFSQHFFRLTKLIWKEAEFNVVFKKVTEKDFPKGSLALADKLVAALIFVLSKDFVEKHSSVSDEGSVLLEILIKKIMFDLGSCVTPFRKRGGEESKSYYLRIGLDRFLKSAEPGLGLTVVNRLLNVFHRWTEHLSKDQINIFCDFVERRKDFNLPPLEKGDVLKNCPVLSLRTYRRYVLSTEWSTTLKHFPVDEDIKLEKRLSKAYSKRDLRPFFDRIEHNSTYQNHHFDLCKAVLDHRAALFKEVFTSVKNRKKSEQRKELAPPLETLFNSADSAERRIAISHALALWLASFGLNFKDSILNMSLIYDVDGRLDIPADEMSSVWQRLLDRRSRIKKSTPFPSSYDEFDKLFEDHIHEIRDSVSAIR
jgi:hypothetical protein